LQVLDNRTFGIIGFILHVKLFMTYYRLNPQNTHYSILLITMFVRSLCDKNFLILIHFDKISSISPDKTVSRNTRIVTSKIRQVGYITQVIRYWFTYNKLSITLNSDGNTLKQ